MNVFRKNQPFRTMAIATFFSTIGSVLFNFVFIIYAQKLSYATAALSLVSVANILPTVVTIINGHLADQTPPQKRFGMIVAFRCVQALLYVLLAVLIGDTASKLIFGILLLINIASDMIADYTNGLGMHYLQHFLKNRDEYQAGAGFMTGVGTTISVVFQALGASLIVLLNHNYALFGLINALSFLIAGLVLYRKRQAFKAADLAAAKAAARAQAQQQNRGGLREIIKSLQNIMQNELLASMLLLALLINTIGTALDGLANVLLAGTRALWFGNFANTVAVIGVVSSVAMIVASLSTKDPLQKLSLPKLTLITMVSLVIFSVNMVWWQNRYVMLVLMAVCMFPIGKINPRMSAEMMAIVAPERLATTSSAFQTVTMLGAPLGIAIFLGIANLFNPIAAWIAYAIAAALISVVAVIIIVRARKTSVKADAVKQA
ncbi:MFS transporter [Lacticaseibacillus zhaodongensis]|uniref:MFS transporter n=1 Tax=Lacticaseibacillus zhaodongensis TaxID=2668065 RepID=UPI0012D2D262|nr:MFS transporter [Lacticaseibacillus zhaodongensis]